MPRYSKAKIKAALEATHGQKFLAAKLLGCSHNTIQTWLDKHEDLRELQELESGALLDVSELKLADAVMAGEAWAIKWLQSTKGKDRGYVQQQEITGPQGGPLNVRVTYDNGD